MQTNYIPDTVNELLLAIYPEFIIYSFDVSSNGRFAIISLGLEDPDFPELWIYDERDGDVKKIDDKGVLIDSAMIKCFWAENNKDVVIVSRDEPPEYSLMVLTADFEFIEEDLVDNPSDYMLARNSQVLSFLTHNIEDLGVPKSSSSNSGNPYESCMNLFIQDFKEMIDEERVICQMSGEEGKNTWNIYRYLFGQILLPLNERIAEYGLESTLNTTDINLSELEVD